ncbi:hypothetical protein J4P90_16340 [Bacillus sp. SY8(2021)]|uniref:Uncharacterized protein n=1 Tax=Bacillus arachidis TaxID=2819290 RepID=A0ABS3P0R2_9BACI|nr:hypothetical protein [Bacillus arachidis]
MYIFVYKDGDTLKKYAAHIHGKKVLFFIFSYTFVINTLEELYNTINVLTEAFSKYYWDAEKVNG